MTRRGTRSLFRRAAIAAAAIAALIPPAAEAPLRAAPSPGPQEVVIRPRKPLQHEVAVVRKLVQVYVTDRRGRPVEDLEKGDFSLTDNGQPVTITEFERHIVDGPGTDAPPGEAASALGLSREFILFFDFAFNNPRGVRKAKEAATSFLETQVRPGDRLGLFSYSLTRGLTVHEFLTQDHAKVRRALAALDARGIAGRADDIEQEYWRVSVEGQPPGITVPEDEAPPPKDNPLYSWRRQETKSEAQNFMIRMTDVARSLRYVPGRKNVVLFSAGISNSLIYGTQVGNPEDSRTRARFDTGDHILRSMNEEMLKELATSDCAVFTFDTREAAMVPSLFAYDEQTFEARYRDIFTDQGVHQNPNLILKDETLTGLYSLRHLAKATGGNYYGNIDEQERNLGALAESMGAFYVLGFPAAEAWDGAYHEIKVEVARRGCEVRAQQGFYNPRPFGELSALERQLHLYDLALSDNPVFQAPLAADLAALAAPAGPAANLLLVTRIPPETIDKLGPGRTEIVTFAFDERDHLADLRKAEDEISRHAGKPVYYASGGSVPPGAYRCRVVIRNLTTGRAAVAASPVFVPGPQAGGLRLHSLLLLAPVAEAVFLEGRAGAAEEPAGGGRPWLSLYAFDRTKYAPVLSPLAWGTFRVYGAVPCSVAGIPEAQIALRAALVNTGTGERVEIPLVLRDRTAGPEGTFVQFFEAGLSGTTPGSYRLYVYAEEKTTGALSYSSAPLTLR